MWEWQILAHARHGTINQNRLAEATAQHPAAVSRLLTDLEGQGLVRRVRAPDDRRCVLVELTTAGHAKYLHLAEGVWATMAERMAVLDVQEMADLQRLLTKVLVPSDQQPGAKLPSCATRVDGA